MNTKDLIDLVSYCREDLLPDPRPRMCGILVETTEGGHRAVATDGCRMAIAETHRKHDIAPGRYEADCEPMDAPPFVGWEKAIADLTPERITATVILSAAGINRHLYRTARRLLCGRHFTEDAYNAVCLEISQGAGCDLRVGPYIMALNALYVFDVMARLSPGAVVRRYGELDAVEFVDQTDGLMVRHLVMPEDMRHGPDVERIADEETAPVAGREIP